MDKCVNGEMIAMTPQEEADLLAWQEEMAKFIHPKPDSERITELEEALNLLLSGETGGKA